MKKYLAFDVGCIECGEESGVVGVFDTKEDADNAATSYTDADTYWGRPEWSGQHSIEVFEVDV